MSSTPRRKTIPHRALNTSVLAEITAALSASRDPDRVLELVASSAVRLFGCRHTTICLLREASHQHLDLIRADGLSEAYTAVLRGSLQQAAGRLNAISANDPILVPNIAKSDLPDEQRTASQSEGIGAYAELPLLTQGDVIGIVTLYFDKPRRFAKAEVELLRTFASQAALAIANARLYAGIESALIRYSQQLQALKVVNRELNATLELRRLCEVVLERAMAYIGATAGCLHVQDADKNRLTMVTARGYSLDVIKLPDSKSVIEKIAARVMRGGRPVMLDDVRQDPAYVETANPNRSHLSVPIKHETQTLGVITLQDPRPGLFDDDQLGFISQLAGQAAVAIVNARLYQNVSQNHDRLQAVLNSTREGVLVIDATGHIALANPRIEALWGMARADLVGQNLAELLKRPSLGIPAKLGFTTGELLELLINLSQNLDVKPSRQTYQIGEPTPLFIERSGTPVIDENRRVIGWVLVLRDVTEEKQAEAAREELTGMMVHDLRTPLTSVLTSLKLIEEMARESENADDIHGVMDISLRSTRKMIQMVDSLLDIFKAETGSMEIKRAPQPLRQIALRVFEDLSSLAEQQEIRLVNAISDDLPALFIDRDKVERVITNLVDNGLKFTPPHGEIIVRASQWQAAELPETSRPRYVLCEVLDTGPGIPDEYRRRIFDRFVQVGGREGRRRGVGLGLAFCKMVVEAHGGRIWVENRPEGGSTFNFTLPIADSV